MNLTLTYVNEAAGYALILAAVIVAAWLGYHTGAAEADALRAEYERSLFRAADQASRDLYAAQQRGDTLTRELAQRTEQHRQLSEALRHEVAHHVTDQRVCLREPALRLLNHAPGLSVHLPESAGQPVTADAGRVTTDTDLTRWAIDAGERYAECVARLDALIRWHTTATTEAPTRGPAP